MWRIYLRGQEWKWRDPLDPWLTQETTVTSTVILGKEMERKGWIGDVCTYRLNHSLGVGAKRNQKLFHFGLEPNREWWCHYWEGEDLRKKIALLCLRLTSHYLNLILYEFTHVASLKFQVNSTNCILIKKLLYTGVSWIRNNTFLVSKISLKEAEVNVYSYQQFYIFVKCYTKSDCWHF